MAGVGTYAMVILTLKLISREPSTHQAESPTKKSLDESETPPKERARPEKPPSSTTEAQHTETWENPTHPSRNETGDPQTGQQNS